MAGAIEKKKNEVVDELETQPIIHIDARTSILKDIGLSREFAQTYLQAVCQRFGSNPYYSVANICENLAAQRLICIGARDLQVAGTGIQKFTFPAYQTVNAALTLTEPNTSYFGFVCTTIDEKTTITLQNTAGTQTIDGNTFSTRITDYYLSRSRISGELEDINANLSVYTTPDGTDDNVFGNAIAWGSSVAGEEDANTWNYHWARANVTGTSVKNSGGVLALNVITLADHLTQGSNTNYTPQGPSFGNKFYLKRHADAVNTFTITGTTTVNSVDITGISDTDIVKTKYNDVISGTGIPSGAGGPVKIAAALTKKNQIRMGNITYTTGTVGQAANVVTLSSGTWPSTVEVDSVVTISGGGGNVVSRDSDTQVTIDNSASVSTGTSYSMSYPGKATATGTVTITVNSVPFGHGADTIFCQLEVSGEGLVANSTWTPVGDTNGTYPNNSEHDLCNANTSQYIALLGFFDPAQASGGGANDLSKGGSGDYISSGKEYNETSYPDIETNPMFPSTGGTTKAAATENGEITGTQPTGLSDKDVWCGRFVSFNKDRENAAGAVTDFRYVVDNAEKYFYLPAHWRGYSTGSTAVVQDPNKQYTHASKAMGGNATGEPRAEMPRQPLSGVITRVVTVDNTGGHGTNTSVNTVPADSAIKYASALTGVGYGPNFAAGGVDTTANNRTVSRGSYYIKEANNFITINHVQCTITHVTTCGSTAYTVVYTNHLDSTFPCYYNFVRQHVTGTGADVSDYNFVKACAVSLASLSSFRDPIITGAHGTNGAGAGGISDANFDGKDSDVTANTVVAESALGQFVTDFNGSGRVAHPASGTGVLGQTLATGSAINYESLSGSKTGVTAWENTRTAMAALSTACDQRIVEIDNRIGKPTYAGTPSSAGTAPVVKVSAIPASNTGSGHVPYGRALFNNANHLLGQDVDLLGGILKDVESLAQLTESIKTARNKYEIYSGRDKEY